ncbi:MAG: DUF3422 domain-containing protein [Enterobacterales bacterium]|nr:DUF3422 domain-containing protein [Enterobacterales bacterium]
MIKFHPLHLELHQEIHARPYPRIAAPCVISHIAFYHEEKVVEQEYQSINDLAKRYHVNGISPGTHSYFQEFEQFHMRWENHREFSTITIIRPLKKPINTGVSALEMFPEGWLKQFPGEAISAVSLLISDEFDESMIEDYLAVRPNIASRLIDDQFTVWTSLQLDSQGFTRLFMGKNSLIERDKGRMQLGRVVLKLLEIETYRQMALLGLPLAKSIAPIASDLGQKCALMLEKMTHISEPDEESALLQELMSIAAEVEKLRASTNYRFAATFAYAELVNSRIKELDQQRVEGKDPLGEFVQRRFMPAIRTCDSVRRQLESLSKRLTRASDLLRTRVDQTIAEQNKKLLESMNRRSHIQLRLQQTVEGLSVAAISYYLISLLKIFLHGINGLFFTFNENIVLTLAAPLVLVTIFIIVRNMKKHYVDSL